MISLQVLSKDRVHFNIIMKASNVLLITEDRDVMVDHVSKCLPEIIRIRRTAK